jgi:hypothetical protein
VLIGEMCVRPLHSFIPLTKVFISFDVFLSLPSFSYCSFHICTSGSSVPSSPILVNTNAPRTLSYHSDSETEDEGMSDQEHEGENEDVESDGSSALRSLISSINFLKIT